MSNVMKLANAIVRENGIETAKRSAAFDELRKLAERTNAVPACVAAVSNACERLGISKREAAPFVRAFAHSSYKTESNNSLSEMIDAQRAENAERRKALAKTNAEKAAAKKAMQSQSSAHPPTVGDDNNASGNRQSQLAIEDAQ
ncbi:hypothetical protein [Bosea sp. (in: a-proteobacteria)]|jgi:hypothetical protein|uniref:hypothetical protein n=1 Tax=Bosea sp. (in: a-proteobacteria) TaxID=1871050 RepID=UPI002DDC9A29|nr:hypothetical protein [Bosea sp. (in: a-proteobacteria)]HEV2510346.1 hypothetical protein [Bosea sp. (in: a-proteobacteria)]